MSEIRVRMVDAAGTIVNEIKAGAKRKDVAMTYAFLLRDGGNAARANHAILERWSMSGLQWIKRRAWQYHTGKREYGT